MYTASCGEFLATSADGVDAFACAAGVDTDGGCSAGVGATTFGGGCSRLAGAAGRSRGWDAILARRGSLPPLFMKPPTPRTPIRTPPATITRGIRSTPLNSDSHTGQKRRLVSKPQSRRSIFSPQFAQKLGRKNIECEEFLVSRNDYRPKRRILLRFRGCNRF